MPGLQAGLGRGPRRAELRRHRRRRRCTPPISQRARAQAPSWSPTRGCRRAPSERRPLAIGHERGRVRGRHPGQRRRRLGRRGRGAGRRARRSASSPIAARSSSCASIRRRRPTCRWSSTRAGRFYFKPEAGGRLWLSPHDETPCEPCDCAPEEIDVALAIDRLERVVDWRVERGRAQLGGPQELRAGPAAGLRLRAGGPRLLLVRGAGRLRHPDRAGRGRARRRAAARARPTAVAEIDPAPYLGRRASTN